MSAHGGIFTLDEIINALKQHLQISLKQLELRKHYQE